MSDSKENITHMINLNLIEFNHEDIGVYGVGTPKSDTLIAYVAQGIHDAMPAIVDAARKHYKAIKKPALH